MGQAAVPLLAAILKELNLVRRRPLEYCADVLKPLLAPGVFDGKVQRRQGAELDLVTKEGAAAVREAVEVLAALDASGEAALPPPLASAVSVPLSRAAADHCADIGPVGMTGHDGT